MADACHSRRRAGTLRAGFRGMCECVFGGVGEPHLAADLADGSLRHLGKHRITHLAHDGGAGSGAAVRCDEGDGCGQGCCGRHCRVHCSWCCEGIDCVLEQERHLHRREGVRC